MDHPRRLRYGLLGLALAAGAPLGLLALRLAVGQASLERLDQEWARDRLTYAYVALSTACVFACFGAALGSHADRLSRLAVTDPLTRLLNRAGLATRLVAELRRLERVPAPLSLLLVDVDRMKRINDRHGHAAGDDALRQVASAIVRSCRATDVAGRWGGDEFLVVAPATSLDDARVLAERIRATAGEAGAAFPLSVSVGASCVTPDVEPSIGDLLQRADEALYEAKRQPRDGAPHRRA